MRKAHNIACSALRFKSLTDKNKCGLYIHEYQAYDLLKKYQLPLVPVIFWIFRVSVQVLLMMPMPLLKGLWLKQQKINLLLI